MSVIDDIRKVLQDFLAPELRTINTKLDGLNEKLDYKFQNMEYRFADLTEKLALDKRISHLEQRTEEKRAS